MELVVYIVAVKQSVAEPPTGLQQPERASTNRQFKVEIQCKVMGGADGYVGSISEDSLLRRHPGVPVSECSYQSNATFL